MEPVDVVKIVLMGAPLVAGAVIGLVKINNAFKRLEYILTGADGKNGMRKDVTDIKKACDDNQSEIRDVTRTLHGNGGDEQGLVHSVRMIERRMPPDKEPNPGRRSGDRRRKRVA